MKNLTLLLAVFFLVSCTKDDTFTEYEAINPDVIKFSARSQNVQNGHFRGHLSGEYSHATGQVVFTFAPDNSFVHYKLLVAGAEDVISANLFHSHMDHDHAVLNLSGHVMGKVNGILSEGFLTDEDITCSCNEMSHHTLSNIRQHMEAGETYVAVETIDQNSDIQGEIR